MKYLKLLIFSLFLSVLFIPKAFALSYSVIGLRACDGTISSNSSDRTAICSQNNIMKNREGTFYFNVLAENGSTGTQVLAPLMQVQGINGSKVFLCQFGTLAYDIGTSTGGSQYTMAVYQVSCKLNVDANGIQNLYLDFGPGNVHYKLGSTMYYISNEDTLTAQDLLDFQTVLRGDLNTLLQAQNTTNTKIDTIISNFSSMITQQQNTTNAVNDVNDSLNSDDISSSSETSGQASDWANNNASDSAVSDMVAMPLTLITAYANGMNGTCSTFSLGSLYGKNLELPCINISNYLGSALWNIIDILFSGFMIFAMGKKFVKIFNDFTNLKDTQVDELYGGGA